MQLVIIIGTIWISLLVVALWTNYRFHRSHMVINNQEFILENSITAEIMYGGARS